MKTSTSENSHENKVYMIPTQLAEIWGVPVRKFNKILMQQGFQEKIITEKLEYEWNPTEKGKEFATYGILKSGPPMLQLLWDRSILDDLDESEEELLNSAAIQKLLKSMAESGEKKDINVCRTCSEIHEDSLYCKYCGTPVETVSVPVNPTACC